MATALPDPSAPVMGPPDRDEVIQITRGLKTAMQPNGQLTDLQAQVLTAITASMTGHELDVDSLEPLGPAAFARGLAGRDFRFRMEMVQLMDLGHMILDEPHLGVADRIIHFATELGVPTERLEKARALADGSAQLVAALDYFAMAHRDIDEVRRDLGITAKSDRAIAAGSSGPFEPGGISESQLAAGRALAESQDREYDTFGAR